MAKINETARKKGYKQKGKKQEKPKGKVSISKHRFFSVLEEFVAKLRMLCFAATLIADPHLQPILNYA